MFPIRTVETNLVIGPPPGVKDGSIGDLPCKREDTFIYSVWELAPEEREAIANGQNVRLGVGWIGAFPPVSLGVTHLQKEDDNG